MELWNSAFLKLYAFGKTKLKSVLPKILFLILKSEVHHFNPKQTLLYLPWYIFVRKMCEWILTASFSILGKWGKITLQTTRQGYYGKYSRLLLLLLIFLKNFVLIFKISVDLLLSVWILSLSRLWGMYFCCYFSLFPKKEIHYQIMGENNQGCRALLICIFPLLSDFPCDNTSAQSQLFRCNLSCTYYFRAHNKASA